MVGLLLFAVLVGFGLYYFFKQNQGATTGPRTTPGQQTGTGELPSSNIRTTTPGGPTGTATSTLPTSNLIPSTGSETFYRPQAVTKIINDYALFPSVSNSGGVRYHNASDGKFYVVGADGVTRAMDDQVFYNVKNVTWAKTANKAVLEYPDGNKIIYNFDSKKQVTLPKHWQDFSFSPDSAQLAAKSIGLAPENRWLVTVKDDGSGVQLIEPLGDNADKVTMDWSPSRQTVAFSQTGDPQGADRRQVLFVGLNGENFKSVTVEGLDFQPQWSPTGQKLLYSVDSTRSDYKPELWVVSSYGDNIGSNRKMLQVNTWAKKCTFVDDNTAVCGVPRDLPEGAGMSPSIAADVSDDLYQIDLRTGIKSQLPLDQDYTIDTISYDSVNKKVVFTDHHLSGAFEVSL